jgi:hypothetical protein
MINVTCAVILTIQYPILTPRPTLPPAPNPKIKYFINMLLFALIAPPHMAQLHRNAGSNKVLDVVVFDTEALEKYRV